MTRLELEQFLKTELISNPLLDLDEYDSDPDEEDDSRETSDARDEEDGKPEKAEDSIDSDDSAISDEERETLAEANELSEILDSWNEYNEYNSSKYKSADKKNEFIQQAKENRFQQFMEQIAYLGLNQLEDEFAGDMIESCNEYGFLPDDYNIKHVAGEYGISSKRAGEIHEMIMDLYPKGITARNIVECLLAQLKDSYDEDSIVYKIVQNDFENLIHRRYHKIAPKYQVSQEYIFKVRDIISGLDPKPGLRISEVSEDYITPDVIIKLIEDDFEVIINDFYSPSLSINPHYKKMVSTKLYDKDTVRYVREKINSARFLIKSIYMRRRTMERVVLAIIKHQHDFFFNPERILHPMTYSVIAEDLGISESTISRVVKDKYADTPFGIIPLKNFFSSTAGQDTNFESVSRQKVKNCILKYIEDENPDDPVSDQEIVEKLREDNMFISRRIVAKYRDEMGILNSRLRRRN
jgi:RNA polymerase sigma-54 factor